MRRAVHLTWLLTTVGLFAQCSRGESHPAGWVTASSRDGSIVFELPPDYARDGSGDSWTAPAGASGLARRLSLTRRPVQTPDPAWPLNLPRPVDAWENGCGAAAKATDVGCVVDRSRMDTTVARRPYVIEAGRLAESGWGRDGAFVLRGDWARPAGDTVRLTGGGGDRASVEEMRRIALSLRAAP